METEYMHKPVVWQTIIILNYLNMQNTTSNSLPS